MKFLFLRSAVLSCVLTLGLAPLAQAGAIANQSAVQHGLSYLQTQQASDGHINGFEGVSPWAALAFSSNGVDLHAVKTVGGSDLRTYSAANPPGASSHATDWEKAILAITADHQNPYDFGDVNYVSHLRSFESTGQIGSATAINDDIFGVLALIAARDVSSDSVLTGALSFIMSHQLSTGGFNSDTTATTADVDDTAAAVMALQAAEKYGLGGATIANSVTSAMTYISTMKNSDGGYPYDNSYGALSDVSTTSWVLMAFSSTGEFETVASAAAQAYILGTQQPDGSFPYQLPLFDPAGTGDTFNSSYAIPALAGVTWPESVYSGPLPGVGESDVTPTPGPTVAPFQGQGLPSPSPTPQVGAVLGASTSSASPTPPPASGNVLGASTLPMVGTLSNELLLAFALSIAILSGVAVRLRQMRARHQR
jgi:prenyltransferase beta subunit